MKLKEHIKSPLGIAVRAIGLVVISIWSINGFFSWRSYAKFVYEAIQITPINLIELVNIEDESSKVATFTKITNCNLVEIEMRNQNKYFLSYGGGSLKVFMDRVGMNGGKVNYKEPNTLLGLPLCFSPSSTQYQIYKSMRDGETAQNKNENNVSKQNNNENNQQQTGNNNSNIVKVLNRVSLSEENKCYEACSGEEKQKIINEIWEKCLNSGFTTSTPNQVSSSREIKELVEIPETNVYFKKPGYCIGSEYITK